MLFRPNNTWAEASMQRPENLASPLLQDEGSRCFRIPARVGQPKNFTSADPACFLASNGSGEEANGGVETYEKQSRARQGQANARRGNQKSEQTSERNAHWRMDVRRREAQVQSSRARNRG